MIIYVGDKFKGGFVQEVAKDIGEVVEFIPGKAHIKDLEYPLQVAVQGYGGATAAIFEADTLTDSAEVIVAGIERFQRISNAEIILITPTISVTNRLVTTAMDAGIRSFIFDGGTMTDKKQDLMRCLVGDYAKNGRKELAEIEKAREARKNRLGKYKTIGVMGACRRIGCSTQAVQIVKYLQSMGYKACYVEMNDLLYPNYHRMQQAAPEVSYVEKTKLAFDYDLLDEEIGLVTVEGVAMYYIQDRLPQILEKGYDYYVYDYGEYTQQDFKKTSFLKDDIKIIVTGAGAVELDYTMALLQNLSYSNAAMIFSFTAQAERDGVLKLMNDYQAAERCFFSDWTPDPFVLTDPDLYQSVFDLDTKEGMEEKKGKRKGFHLGRKNKKK